MNKNICGHFPTSACNVRARKREGNTGDCRKPSTTSRDSIVKWSVTWDSLNTDAIQNCPSKEGSFFLVTAEVYTAFNRFIWKSQTRWRALVRVPSDFDRIKKCFGDWSLLVSWEISVIWSRVPLREQPHPPHPKGHISRRRANLILCCMPSLSLTNIYTFINSKQ